MTDNTIITSKDLCESLPLVDGELFADCAMEMLPKAFCKAIGCSEADVRTELVEIPFDENMIGEYLLEYDEDTKCSYYRDEKREGLEEDDNTDGKKVCSADDIPDNLYYVKIYYKDMEFALFLDEYGFNGDFWSGVHLQYLCNKKSHCHPKGCERLKNLVKEEAEYVLHDSFADVTYSEDDECVQENMMLTAPYIDLFVTDDVFGEEPENLLTDMLRIMVPVVDNDNAIRYDKKSLTKDEFLRNAEANLRQYARQHFNTYIEFDEAMRIIKEMVDECGKADIFPIHLQNQLTLLKRKIASAEKMRDMYVDDIENNETLKTYWAYWEDLKKGEIMEINHLARKCGLDVTLDMKGISYESSSDANGLWLYDEDLHRTHQCKIWPWTRLLHSKDLKRIKEVLERFYPKHIAFVNAHIPGVEAVENKYVGYSFVFEGKEYVFSHRTFRSTGVIDFYEKLFKYNVWTLTAAYDVIQRTLSE